MKKTFFTIMMAASLVGCGTQVYEIKPYGQDQFAVFSKSRNPAESRSKSIDKANAFCAEKSKTMQPIQHEKAARHRFEFIFSCT